MTIKGLVFALLVLFTGLVAPLAFTLYETRAAFHVHNARICFSLASDPADVYLHPPHYASSAEASRERYWKETGYAARALYLLGFEAGCVWRAARALYEGRGWGAMAERAVQMGRPLLMGTV